MLGNSSRAPVPTGACSSNALTSVSSASRLRPWDTAAEALAEAGRPGHPLLHCPNTVLTPHLGNSVLEVYRVFFAQCIENVTAYLGNPVRVLPAQPVQ